MVSIIHSPSIYLMHMNKWLITIIHWVNRRFYNMAPYAKRPVLACFLTCRFGQAAESLSDSEVVAGCVAQLRRAFAAMMAKSQAHDTVYANGCTSIPDPIGHLVTRWNSDPYAYGAYTHFGVGSSKRYTAALAAPCGNVYWAGEHTTHINLGTIAGAYTTGVDAATLIQNELAAQQRQKKNSGGASPSSSAAAIRTIV